MDWTTSSDRQPPTTLGPAVAVRRRTVLWWAAATAVRVPLLIVADYGYAQTVKRLAPSWPTVARYGPLVCHADFRLDAYRPVIDELQEMYDALPQRLGLRRASGEVRLFLFHDRTTYRSYMRRYFPSLPHRRALFVLDNERAMVFAYRSDQLEIDVRHETTHAILHLVLPVVPLWLDEGLAEYFELGLTASPLESPHRVGLQQRTVARLEELERLDELGKMSRRDYRDAWAWVHFLLNGPPTVRDEFHRYLLDLQSRRPAGRLSVRLQRRGVPLPAAMTAHVQDLLRR